MTELPQSQQQVEMDNLLRRTLSGPLPTLSPDFDQRLLRELREDSQPLDRFRRILFTGYGLLSVIASIIVLRSQGLNWTVVTATTLAPLALIAIAHTGWRATHPVTPPHSN